MFLAQEQAAVAAGAGGGKGKARTKKQKRGEEDGGEDGEGEDGDGGGQTQNKLLSQLDYRVRVIEGRLPTYFLPHDEIVILPALQAANKIWDDKKPAKGQPHPLGARRCSYAAAFMNCIVLCDISKAEGAALASIEAHDGLAKILGQSTISQQKASLQFLLMTYTTHEKMSSEVSACVFMKCKKPDEQGKHRHIFALEVDPMSGLRYCVDFMRIALENQGAIRADGPPPPGPLVRALPKNRSK